ncbi:MAG: hypothetical protein WCQ82_04975 [Bacteroidaceae bacterium]|nr:hypothetical protein [Bacteroidaceae bacterium]
MMRSKDLKTSEPAKLLVIGEDSNLQWSDKTTQIAMFADYYFRSFPEDHGERSRNVEARNLFSYLGFATLNKIKPNEIYITNLCNDQVAPAPRGKRVLIPEEKAVRGLSHIEWILEENPTIEYVFVMSMQSNYWLQKLGFYPSTEEFLKGAEPRRKGLEDMDEPFYQPVNGKVFRTICAQELTATKFPVKVFPILPAKDYPFTAKNSELFAAAYEKLRTFFSTQKK